MSPQLDPVPTENSPKRRVSFGMLALVSILLAGIALCAAAFFMIVSSDDERVVAAADVPSDAELAALYAQEANRLCADAVRMDELFAPTTGTQLAAVLRVSIDASMKPLAKQLAALTPSSGQRAAHSAAVRSGQQQVDVLENLVLRLRAGQKAEVVTSAAGQRLIALQRQSNRAYTELGADGCVSPVGPPNDREEQ